MFVKQLSIFVENKSGRFPEILDILSKEEVRIIASSVADTSEFGILRMITEDNDRAYQLLSTNRVSVSQNNVLVLSTTSLAGSIGKLLKPFSKNGINIDYMYYFAAHGTGYMVLRTNDEAKTKEVVLRENMKYLTADDLKAL